MIFESVWSNPLDNTIEIAFSNFFDLLPKFLKNLISIFSSFGDYAIFFIFLAIIFLLFKDTRKYGFYLIILLIVNLLLNDLILKNIFQRTRPYNDENLVKDLISIQNNNGVIYGIVPSSTSFPSGHTSTAFSFLSVLVCDYIFKKDDRKKSKKLIIFASIYAPLMGLSRILLSHHYFTDVLAGLLLGIIYGIITYFIYKLILLLLNKYKNKNNDKIINEEK